MVHWVYDHLHSFFLKIKPSALLAALLAEADWQAAEPLHILPKVFMMPPSQCLYPLAVLLFFPL